VVRAGRKFALSFGSISYYTEIMNDATLLVKRKKGRPRAYATLVGVSLPPPLLSILDRWIAEQPDKPGRPEAIRRLLRQVLDSSVTKE
jgi:hypothetical protein